MSSSNYICCNPCRIRVDRASFVFAILSLISNIGCPFFTYTSKGSKWMHNFGEYLPHGLTTTNAIYAVINFLVIIGYLKRSSCFYLPYLIVSTIIHVIWALIWIFLVGFTVYRCFVEVKDSTTPLQLFLADVIIFNVLALSIWFCSVFYRAYHFIKAERDSIRRYHASPYNATMHAQPQFMD